MVMTDGDDVLHHQFSITSIPSPFLITP